MIALKLNAVSWIRGASPPISLKRLARSRADDLRQSSRYQRGRDDDDKRAVAREGLFYFLRLERHVQNTGLRMIVPVGADDDIFFTRPI